MKVAILETIVPSGHEVEYNRGIYTEMLRQGHEPYFLTPENLTFRDDYGAPRLVLEGGEPISYRKAGFFKKLCLSVLREYRRIQWFNSAHKIVEAEHFDYVLIPSASPRYLRSLRLSSLRNSRVPVVVNHQIYNFGIRGRLEQFRALAQKMLPYKNIHITFCTHYHMIRDIPNVSYVNPPFYGPTLIDDPGRYDGHEPLVIGLYGVYRTDPNTHKLLEVFAKAEFKTPIQVRMQTVTNNARDKASCDELITAYQDNPRFCFFDDFLFAKSWQEAMARVDIMLVPYAARQYYYAYSAMCFNALGFRKPVMISPNVNPQLLESYDMGMILDFENEDRLKAEVVEFIDTFKEKYPHYQAEMERAARVYNFPNLVRDLLNFSPV
ncbi:MAG: hypothetical protein K6F05_05005 [Succinivibrio sp.]|nr:hypothetical protein [Succinivibrio sp.]